MQAREILPSIFEFQLPDEINTLFKAHESIAQLMRPMHQHPYNSLDQISIQNNQSSQQSQFRFNTAFEEKYNIYSLPKFLQVSSNFDRSISPNNENYSNMSENGSSALASPSSSTTFSIDENGQQKNIRGWTAAEDILLREAVAQFRTGPIKWEVVAKNVPRRNMKQCRERWEFHLNPDINKDPFDQNEDRLIIAQQKKLGNRWTIIAEQLPGRTSSSVKNRWYTVLKKLSPKEVSQLMNYPNMMLYTGKVTRPNI